MSVTLTDAQYDAFVAARDPTLGPLAPPNNAQRTALAAATAATAAAAVAATAAATAVAAATAAEVVTLSAPGYDGTNFMGKYTKCGTTSSGHPMYKGEDDWVDPVYLYYDQKRGMWRVGPDPTRTSCRWRVTSTAMTPMDIVETWEVWDEKWVQVVSVRIE